MHGRFVEVCDASFFICWTLARAWEEVAGSIMTIARHDEQTMPPLARRLCTEEGARGLYQRILWVCLIATLAPSLVLGAGLLAFFHEIGEAYLNGTEIWGWPVVAIGEEARGWISIGRRPVGVVAIGSVAVGVFAVGPVAVGVVSAGVLAIGLVSVGPVLVIGVFSVGIVTLAWFSHGLIAAGRLAWGGIVAVGWYAVANVAIGAYAWGISARGFYRAESRIVMPPRPPVGSERLLFPNRRPPQSDSG